VEKVATTPTAVETEEKDASKHVISGKQEATETKEPEKKQKAKEKDADSSSKAVDEEDSGSGGSRDSSEETADSTEKGRSEENAKTTAVSEDGQSSAGNSETGSTESEDLCNKMFGKMGGLACDMSEMGLDLAYSLDGDKSFSFGPFYAGKGYVDWYAMVSFPASKSGKRFAIVIGAPWSIFFSSSEFVEFGFKPILMWGQKPAAKNNATGPHGITLQLRGQINPYVGCDEGCPYIHFIPYDLMWDLKDGNKWKKYRSLVRFGQKKPPPEDGGLTNVYLEPGGLSWGNRLPPWIKNGSAEHVFETRISLGMSFMFPNPLLAH